MLIQSPLKLNDIVTLKLIGGDEIIGKLTDERTDTYVEVKKPLVVMMAQQGFGLMPFMLTGNPDATVKIDRSHVLAMSKTMDQVSKEYIKQTTGLTV
jgi:hypothetical protein